jgi:hypothetical protein
MDHLAVHAEHGAVAGAVPHPVSQHSSLHREYVQCVTVYCTRVGKHGTVYCTRIATQQHYQCARTYIVEDEVTAEVGAYRPHPVVRPAAVSVHPCDSSADCKDKLGTDRSTQESVQPTCGGQAQAHNATLIRGKVPSVLRGERVLDLHFIREIS